MPASQSTIEDKNQLLSASTGNCSTAYQVFHAANIIRAEILNTDSKLPWPLKAGTFDRREHPST